MTGTLERLERNTRRTAEVGAVLVRYGLADWLRRIPLHAVQDWLRDPEGQAISARSLPERVRLAAGALGTTFIKIGQILSTRPDLVGRELAHELAKLQTSTPADPPGAGHAVFEQELGCSPDAAFAWFDAAPFASASIAQVHYARLHTGESVVVKIQKSGIEERIEADLSILADLAALAEKHVEESRPYRPVAVVRQLGKMFREELDFVRERRNLEAFRRAFADDATVRFPRPCPELSSRRVLTMERLDGILVSDIDTLRASAADVDGFARAGANMYLEMIFRDSFYHADPHPGNLMLLEGDVVGVVDCGMVQRLDDTLRDDIEDVLLALARGDGESLAAGVWRLGGSPPGAARDQLRADLGEFVAEYASRSLKDVQLSNALASVIDIIHRNHIFLPSGASVLLRTLVELEGTAQLLSPGFSLAELVQPYYRRSMRRRYSPERLALQLQRGSRDWARLIGAMPGEVTDILERIRAGSLDVHLDHRRLDPVVNRLVLGLLTSALFLGSSLLWSMEAPPLVSDVSLFGAIGYTVSIVMATRLLRAVRRSERPGQES